MKDDIQSLLGPLSPESPAGTDIEYDPDFAELVKASQGTQEQEFGDTRIEGEPADWSKVYRLAVRLLGKSRDLRVAAYLVEADLIARGLVGLSESLEVIASMVETCWDSLYPQLDPDDDNDPTIRLNALLRLTNRGGLIRQLKATPIARSRSAGQVAWNDLAMARGEIPVMEGVTDPPTTKRIEAVVQSSDVDELGQWLGYVDAALARIHRITEAFAKQVGSSNAPDLEVLEKELEGVAKLQRGWIKQLGGTTTETTAANESQAEGPAPTSSSSSSGESRDGNIAFASGTIHKREDAIEGLNKIIRWFEMHEPSSPIPMLLKRAKRLANMSFLDVLRELSPDGLNQALFIGGSDAREEEAPPPPPAKPTPPPKPKSPPREEEY